MWRVVICGGFGSTLRLVTIGKVPCLIFVESFFCSVVVRGPVDLSAGLFHGLDPAERERERVVGRFVRLAELLPFFIGEVFLFAAGSGVETAAGLTAAKSGSVDVRGGG